MGLGVLCLLFCLIVRRESNLFEVILLFMVVLNLYLGLFN